MYLHTCCIQENSSVESNMFTCFSFHVNKSLNMYENQEESCLEYLLTSLYFIDIAFVIFFVLNDAPVKPYNRK